MVVFVVKRYAVREAEKWRYAVRKAKIRRYAVRQGGGGCHPQLCQTSYISCVPLLPHTLSSWSILLTSSCPCLAPVSSVGLE